MTEYFMQVGDYIEGRLSETAKQAFETEMSTNQELKRAVDNYDVMDKALDMLWEDDARSVAMEANIAAKESELGDMPVEKKEANVLSLKRLMAVAASVAVLVTTGYFLMQNMDTPTSELYAEFYSPYMGNHTRGTNDNLSSLALCEQGHILMENQEFSKAIDVFIESIKSDEACNQKSQWYLSLCYLSQNKTEARDSLLDVISSSTNHKYQSLAKALIKKL